MPHIIIARHDMKYTNTLVNNVNDMQHILLTPTTQSVHVKPYIHLVDLTLMSEGGTKILSSSTNQSDKWDIVQLFN